jgi:hypothetical protein
MRHEVTFPLDADERRKLGAFLQAHRQAKAAAGGYVGGRPATGYEAYRGALRINLPEAEVVRWIFDRCANDGWSIRAIARALDSERTLGRRWHTTTVMEILHREDYKRGPVGNRIIDPRTWNRAQAVLATRRLT